MRTPEQGQDSLQRSIRLTLILRAPVQSELAHDQHTDVVSDSHWTYAFPVGKLVGIHHADDHDGKEESVAHVKDLACFVARFLTKHGRAKVGMTGCYSKERVDGEEKNESLGKEGEVMVDKATLLSSVKGRPCSLVDEPFVESCFEYVLAKREEYNEQLMHG